MWREGQPFSHAKILILSEYDGGSGLFRPSFSGSRAVTGYAFVGQDIWQGAGGKISQDVPPAPWFSDPVRSGAFVGIFLREGRNLKSVPGAGISLYDQGNVLRTLLVTCRALGAVSALFALGMTTPATELTSVLKQLHCPDLICSLMYLMYRYIFLMYQVHGNMKQAAEGRMGYVDLRTSLLQPRLGSMAICWLIVTVRREQILMPWKAAVLAERLGSFRADIRKTGKRRRFLWESFLWKQDSVSGFAAGR